MQKHADLLQKKKRLYIVPLYLGGNKDIYKREIKEQFDLYETAMDNYDELADFSLEDLE